MTSHARSDSHGWSGYRARSALDDHNGFSDGRAESSSHAGSRESGSASGHTSSIAYGSLAGPRRSPRHSPITDKQRSRHSGGFLLDRTLGRGKEKSRLNKSPRQSGKGKETTYDTLPGSAAQEGYDGRYLDGSPTTGRAQRGTTTGSSTVGGTSDESRPSMGSAHDNDLRSRTPDRAHGSNRSSLDPAQLVQMALNLSQGRRRYASATLSPPVANGDSRRVRSSGAPVVRSGSPLINDQTQDEPFSRLSDSSPHGQLFESPRSIGDNGTSVPELDLSRHHDGEAVYDFSTGTIARAEKVRRYFELAEEYQRFLQYLPPLTMESGSYTYSTRNQPGSAFPAITRTRSTSDGLSPLGRQYNPLQLLRNRKTRTTERRHLVPPPSDFEDLENVRQYLDKVEDNASTPLYRSESDGASLPAFNASEDSQGHQNHHTGKTHRRTDTASSRTQWTESAWSFTPSELFADTIWTEIPENKRLIEGRRGQKLFPTAVRVSMDHNRPLSRKEAHAAGRPRSATTGTFSIREDESIPRFEKGHKKRNFLSIHRVEEGARKRLIRSRGRSDSVSSDSDRSETSQRKRRSLTASDSRVENTGPLERHLKRMMDQEEAERSPKLISPEKWEKGDFLPSEEAQAPRSRSGTHTQHHFSFHDRRNKLRPQPLELRRSRSQSDIAKLPRLVTDDLESGNGSPIMRSAVPAFGMSLSPPSSKPQTPTSWPSLKMLDRRSRNSSKERTSNTQATDFAATNGTLVTPQNEDEERRNLPKRSFESSRPSFLSRHVSTRSVSGDHASLKDADLAPNEQSKSGVSRLLKGGRIGDLVRGDRSWRKDQPPSPVKQSFKDIADNDMSDSDNEQSLKRSPTDSSMSKTRPDRLRYNLPSFKSSVGDPFRAPPGNTSRPNLRIDIPVEEADKDSSRNGSSEKSGLRVNLGMLSPLKRARSSNSTNGSRPSLGLPGLSRNSTSNKTQLSGIAKTRVDRDANSPARGKRHWSIADRGERKPPVQEAVTARDVARVRALFLSSGIKARELCSRAEQISEHQPSFLLDAASKSGEALSSVKRRDEYALAIKLWSQAINASLQTSDKQLDVFRNEKVPKFRERMEILQQRAAEQLTLRVHETADEADALTYDLNTHQTLAVKQVNDAIDDMIRYRRRRLRWVRRIGFTLLEWLLLGIMWGVWFVVVVLRMVRDAGMSLVKGARWLLWL